MQNGELKGHFQTWNTNAILGHHRSLKFVAPIAHINCIDGFTDTWEGESKVREGEGQRYKCL